MFVRSSKGGRTAALLISGLLAALVLTGSASPRTTYHITDGEAVYTVTGQPDDTEGALALAGVEVSERDRVTYALQAVGSLAVTVPSARPTPTSSSGRSRWSRPAFRGPSPPGAGWSPTPTAASPSPPWAPPSPSR